MVWVIGIGIFLLLLFNFPRQMIGLLAVLAVIGGGVWAYSEASDAARKSALKNVVMSASATCTQADYPIYLNITNNSGKTVKRTYFSVSGYRSGFSDSVVSNLLSTDKIMKPGEGYAACWRLSTYGKDIDYKALDWKAQVTSIEFE